MKKDVITNIVVVVLIFVVVTFLLYSKYKPQKTTTSNVTVSSETIVESVMQTKVENEVKSENTIIVDTSKINEANNMCIDDILSKL
jgi:flagellar biosynthesis/type III secretory pathway M-ring protein FliF/YscJ